MKKMPEIVPDTLFLKAQSSITNSSTNRGVKVWEFKNASANDVATLVSACDKDLDSGMFDAEGASLSWLKSPRVEVFIEPRAKEAKQRVDISPLTHGASSSTTRPKRLSAPFCHDSASCLSFSAQTDPSTSTT